MRRSIVVAMATIVAAVVAGVAVPSPARARDVASIDREIYLADVGSGTVFLPPAGPRRIYLDPGWYEWWGGVVETDPSARPGKRDERSIYLAQGTYDWRCSMPAHKGPAYNYTLRCWLDPTDPRYDTVYLPSDYPLQLSLSGNYHWFSFLA